MYLFESSRRSSIHWFIPQMASIARARPGWSQNLFWGRKVLGTESTASQAHSPQLDWKLSSWDTVLCQCGMWVCRLGLSLPCPDVFSTPCLPMNLLASNMDKEKKNRATGKMTNFRFESQEEGGRIRAIREGSVCGGEWGGGIKAGDSSSRWICRS